MLPLFFYHTYTCIYRTIDTKACTSLICLNFYMILQECARISVDLIGAQCWTFRRFLLRVLESISDIGNADYMELQIVCKRHKNLWLHEMWCGSCMYVIRDHNTYNGVIFVVISWQKKLFTFIVNASCNDSMYVDWLTTGEK